jgi:probable rRNA maturation factor
MPAAVPVPSFASPDASEGRSPADAEPPIGLSVDVVHEAGDWGTLNSVTEAAKAAAAAVGAELRLDASEACVALSSDAQVAQLNATYRGKPLPTNVLSFPANGQAPAAAGQARVLGDVVLAAETVSREAAELELPLTSHLQHLVVHGLLHLLGYDHESDEEAHAMETLEIRILARLGIANPYEAAGEPLSSCQQQTEFLES